MVILIDGHRWAQIWTPKSIGNENKTGLIIIAVIIFVIISSPAALADGTNATDCMDTAYTSYDMVMCRQEQVDVLADELNDLLAAIKDGQPASVQEKIDTAQKAWHAHIEADLDMQYHDHNGSIAGTCYGGSMTHAYTKRIEQLKKYATRQQGDVCSPSFSKYEEEEK